MALLGMKRASGSRQTARNPRRFLRGRRALLNR